MATARDAGVHFDDFMHSMSISNLKRRQSAGDDIPALESKGVAQEADDSPSGTGWPALQGTLSMEATSVRTAKLAALATREERRIKAPKRSPSCRALRRAQRKARKSKYCCTVLPFQKHACFLPVHCFSVSDKGFTT
eukprot:TRINITY_DN56096_c0_g1_i1.p3 TRINITY_DN56096_c0_g1~~TRINITY_DN56096_c0_g1_i1.p3  ORF type:complete len:137 (-),score=21.94 TRINITY_DN56096_c0_g1_i1:240-650(-)